MPWRQFRDGSQPRHPSRAAIRLGAAITMPSACFCHIDRPPQPWPDRHAPHPCPTPFGADRRRCHPWLGAVLKIGAQVWISVCRIKVAMLAALRRSPRSSLRARQAACPYQTEDHLAHLYLRRAAPRRHRTPGIRLSQQSQPATSPGAPPASVPSAKPPSPPTRREKSGFCNRAVGVNPSLCVPASRRGARASVRGRRRAAT
jgi:hypothetical protein